MSEATPDNLEVMGPGLTPAGPVSPPLAPWQVFLLTFFTFTLYSSFWMYRAASDIAKLDSEKRIPFLWFFSPLLAITLIGSVPRLLGRYDVVMGVTRWEPKATGLGALTFLTSVVIGFSERIEIATWLLLVLLAAYSLGFALIQRATNDLKSHIKEEHFSRKSYTFSGLHWVVLTLATVVLALLAYVEIDDQLSRAPGKPIATGTLLPVPETDLTLAFVGGGWKQVEIGTYSDGSAIAEYEGPTDYQWLIVFDQGKDRDIYNWIDFRSENAEDSDDMDLECTELITNTSEGDNILAEVVCKGEDIVGDPLLEIFTLRGVGDHYWETMGHLTAPSLTYRAHEKKLIALAQSLRPGSTE